MHEESMEPCGVGMAAGRPLLKLEPTAIWTEDNPYEQIVVFRESPVQEEETPGIGYCLLQNLLAFLEREGWITSTYEE